MTATTVKSWLRNALTKNLGSKGLAFALTVVFFYMHETESMSQRTLSVPVIAMLDPGQDRILVSGFPEQVTLRLQGPVSVLKELRSQDVGPAVVPVTEITDQQFRFTRQNFNLPESVKITTIFPEAVPVEFEDRIEKQVPLEAEIRGTTAPGRYLGDRITIKPEVVTIAGARSAVERINRWQTEPLYVNELEPGLHEINLNLAPPDIANVYLKEESSASVTVEVLQKTMTKWFRKVPIGVEGIEPAGITVKPTTVSVLVTGPEETVRPLDENMLNFYARLSGEELITIGPFQKPVEFAEPPPGVEFTKISPTKVVVTNHSPEALKATEKTD